MLPRCCCFKQTGESILSLAVKSSNPMMLRQILQLPGMKLDQQDSKGLSTPLIVAVKIDSPEAVRLLLDAKADPTLRTLVSCQKKKRESFYFWYI